MEISIIGTGGFSNDGSFYNCFMIDEHLLAEAPPDILQSLRASSIRLDDIDTLIITHFHGDHCFGLPFLLFNMYIRQNADNAGKTRLRLFAPPGIRERLRTLLGLAISPDHPYIEWALASFEVIEIEEGRRYEVSGDLWLEFSRSYHFPETFSVLAGKTGRQAPDFIATSDTRWGPAIEGLVKRCPKLLLCDSGGSKPGEVHMSPEEISEHILPGLDGATRLLATHYAGTRISAGRLEYAEPGNRFLI
ncbi:MAG: MBL fold metallo-hydrolase [Spirochaetia bacterium]|jgi:hypothetical protein|nr:MBL fold metallo-hydrolase [Spirochaetales bacterium]MDX9783861.1 MBL fold metallo-hydrolase [Spirochaetia bacterium]